MLGIKMKLAGARSDAAQHLLNSIHIHNMHIVNNTFCIVIKIVRWLAG